MGAVCRDNRIDIMKGVAIILVVVCHTDYCHYNAFRHFVHLFHLPVFLMAAGWFFSGEKVDEIKKLALYCVNKLRKIWWPFVGGSLVIAAVSRLMILCGINVCEPFGMVNALKNIPFMQWFILGHTGPMWFLRTLFWVYVFYSTVEYVCRKIRIDSFMVQSIISFILAICGKYVTYRMLKYVGGCPLLPSYAIFHLGVVMRRFCGKREIVGATRNIIVMLAAGVALCVLCKFERLGLAQNRYNNGITLILASAIGWYFVLAFANLIRMYAGRISDCFSYVGMRTLPILIYHMIAMKMVTVLAVWYRGDSEELLSRIPTGYCGYRWLMVYSIVGVGLPLLLDTGWNRTVKLFKRV